jgi:hypothetical protein
MEVLRLEDEPVRRDLAMTTLLFCVSGNINVELTLGNSANLNPMELLRIDRSSEAQQISTRSERPGALALLVRLEYLGTTD